MKSPCILGILFCLASGVGCYPGDTDKHAGGLTAEMKVKRQPVLSGKADNELITLSLSSNPDRRKPVVIKKITIRFAETSNPELLTSVKIYHTGTGTDRTEGRLFGSSESPGLISRIRGRMSLDGSHHTFVVSFVPREVIDLTGRLIIDGIEIRFSDPAFPDISLPPVTEPIRFGVVVRSAGQDSCDTYRIPGLVTTREGTLIAVYDMRYNSSKDLQEDIDIGMSRSTDGGNTWEPMKVILDMGEYGGRGEEYNGAGDPCVLYDHTTHTLWVAAVWISGLSPRQMLWQASAPGSAPDETGQILLVKSTDDGLTWSKPMNITARVKDPAWQLLMQGPGRGLTLKDGTLVFPAQFKADVGQPAIDGGQYTPHSTIMYSTDAGLHWSIGTGAMANTTEAQVVQLSDGSLMLNMRDDRNRRDTSELNGRAVATTTDLGRSWITHPSSNHALPEPNCMASLISADIIVNGTLKKVLFFSNPSHTYQRSHMTIKASPDEGLTWPEKCRLLINENTGFGYSCLTMVNDTTIGILYEGVKNLYFQKIPVREILKGCMEQIPGRILCGLPQQEQAIIR